MAYWPAGRISASTGTRSPTLLKSSSSSGIPAEWAIASKCNTAFVEPSSAILMVIAFSKASRLRMSLGLIPRLMRLCTAAPARKLSCFLASETAFCAELLGSERPNASSDDAMVLAVYMPPHEPGPGIAVASTSFSSMSETLPAACPPTASNTETMSRRSAPGMIVPP